LNALGGASKGGSLPEKKDFLWTGGTMGTGGPRDWKTGFANGTRQWFLEGVWVALWGRAKGPVGSGGSPGAMQQGTRKKVPQKKRK